MENPQALLKKYVPGVEERVIAVHLNGKFSSAFDSKPGGPVDVPVEENVSRGDEHILKATESSSVIVVADIDFMADRYSAVAQNFLGTRVVSLINDNLIFAINAIENLYGSDHLIRTCIHKVVISLLPLSIECGAS